MYFKFYISVYFFIVNFFFFFMYLVFFFIYHLICILYAISDSNIVMFMECIRISNMGLFLRVIKKKFSLLILNYVTFFSSFHYFFAHTQCAERKTDDLNAFKKISTPSKNHHCLEFYFCSIQFRSERLTSAIKCSFFSSSSSSSSSSSPPPQHNDMARPLHSSSVKLIVFANWLEIFKQFNVTKMLHCYNFRVKQKFPSLGSL